MSNLDAKRLLDQMLAQARGAADTLYRRVVNPTPGGPFNTVYVNAQGQVIRAEAGGAGMTLVCAARGTDYITYTLSVPANSETIVPYDDVLYDPHSGVTTGASWSYTVPATGWYQVHASALVKRVNGAGLTPFTGFWDAYLFVDSTGGTTLPSTVWDTNNHTQNSQNTNLYMRGVAHCYLTAGGTISALIGWQPGDGTTDAQAVTESIVIFQC